ncbi:MAG: hypothetical protein V4590_03040 [Bacteroidota bacterium]
MTNATLKKEVLAEIAKADPYLLKMVHAMLKANKQYDFWDDLPAEVKKDVDAALKESGKGLGKSHDEVMLKHKKWLTK